MDFWRNHALLLAFFAGVAATFPGRPAEAGDDDLEIRRCLTGTFTVVVTETIQVFEPGGAPIRIEPVRFQGYLRLGRGRANFQNLQFDSRQTFVLTRKRLVIQGGAQGLELESNQPGALRLTITHRGRRAHISSGRYSRRGIDREGNTQLVTNGIIRGSRRLSPRCH